jgi:serine/threonine-protein kinase
MAITAPLVLPADVIVVPVQELHPQVRDQFECEDGDFAITRPRARTPSRIVDAQAAELLQEFRTPRTIVEAVIRFSQARQTDPEQTLVDAYPLLQGLVRAEMLVPADSKRAGEIVATLEVGGRVLDFDVIR